MDPKTTLEGSRLLTSTRLQAVPKLPQERVTSGNIVSAGSRQKSSGELQRLVHIDEREETDYTTWFNRLESYINSNEVPGAMCRAIEAASHCSSLTDRFAVAIVPGWF